jgi:hypothetical protein
MVASGNTVKLIQPMVIGLSNSFYVKFRHVDSLVEYSKAHTTLSGKPIFKLTVGDSLREHSKALTTISGKPI